MERRTLLLIASLLVAALGTALVWLYVQGADNRARASQDLVPVYVSSQAFRADSPGEDVAESLVRKDLPRAYVDTLADVVRDRTQLRNKRALGAIAANVPLLVTQFGPKGAAPTPGVALDPTKFALALQLNDPARVAGLLQPGSLVTIFGTLQKDAKIAYPRTIAILRSVKVLSAEGVTDDDSRGTVTGRGTAATTATVSKALVYVQVDQVQAQKLILAQSQGAELNTLYFALQGPKAPVVTGDTSAVSGREIRLGDSGNGG